ncbi:ankyrin repeat and fibronectin type-III domain-containing protein 1 isoform 4-T4 [Syngnathus typhle]
MLELREEQAGKPHRGRAGSPVLFFCVQIWAKMSVDSENTRPLSSSRDSRISCVFRAADDKDDDDVQAVGEESVLEMLSCSKLLDLETWLCMPSSLLLPRLLDSARAPSPSSAHSRTAERAAATGQETPYPMSPPVLSSTPAAAVSIGKRRRLAAGPGGLRWKSAGSLLSSEPDEEEEDGPAQGARGRRPARGGGAAERAAVRKTLSADERLLRPAGTERRHLKLLRNIHSLGTPSRFDSRKKSDGKLSRLAQRWNRRAAAGDVLIQDLEFYTGISHTSLSLDRRLPAAMTQQMQNLQLSQGKKVPGGPASPNAAKRLYRNLSEKLRGSTSSFEDSAFSGKTDRLRKASAMQGGSECLFEAVEQQDPDTVRLLLCRLTVEELELNAPDARGLTPLDVAVMSDNAHVAKLLLKAGAREGPHAVSAEKRQAHLVALEAEAERRAAEALDDKQLRAWELRCQLYQRMSGALRHARPPEAPISVRLSVSSSSTLTVTFREPQQLRPTVITKYKVEWSCLKDFSLLAGEMLLENLQSLKCTITGLTTGRLYFVRVSACNMKGWGPPACSLPPSAAPSNWRESNGQEPGRHGHTEAMERLLQQVRAAHDCCGDASKLQNSSRKQSVSRSLKHLFNSSNKFVKTLKRGIYLAAIFYHKDKLLVTAEEQIPIVEVDDSYGSSLMQDFLWFTKLSCMWEDVRWLRQTAPAASASSTLQARHKMLSAAGQLQNLLGTHDLGRVHYEPIKDRHGNVLLVTARDADGQHSLLSGKWVPVAKVQSQRKSLSTPEEPYALDILVITLQDIVAYQRRCSQRLAPGLYLGYLKLSSSVDQIRVLVSQRNPNVLCHVRVRENANVSREEWDWIRTLSATEGADCGEEARPGPESHAPLLYYELQTAIKSLLKNLNLSVQQARHFRLYSQEVVEAGHGVCFLLLLPPADDVCSAPGQPNPYTPLAGFLHLPLQMFELAHFCCYKEKLISLYCRLSTVLDLDALIAQQALREAITDDEVAAAKRRHGLILDYIQQLDESRRDLRWLTEALQSARYKQPCGGVPVTCLVDAALATDSHASGQRKTDSTSSAMDYLPSPEPCRSDSPPGWDEDTSSEVFLPTDSDYDSSDALSPREAEPLSSQALRSLGGSAPDVLHILELRCSALAVNELPPSLGPDESKDAAAVAAFLPRSPSQCKDLAAFSRASPHSLPLARLPRTSPSPPVSRSQREGSIPNPPSKRKLLSRSHRGQYFSGPQRWLRGHSQETGSLSEGVYTKQREPDLPPPPSQGATYVSHMDCDLASRKGRPREQRPHVRRIFTDEGVARSEGAAGQDADSDEQTNAQVLEILSSTL